MTGALGPSSAQATREGASSTGCTGGAKRAVGASTGGVFREPDKVVGKDASAPDTPVPHRSIGRCKAVTVARRRVASVAPVTRHRSNL